MTVLIYCLFITLLLPFIAKLPLAIAMHKQGGYDDNHPRSQQNILEGFGARALAAHKNAFESALIFAPAVLLAIATNHVGTFIQQLAIVHVIARVLYNVFYLLNIGILRSLVWSVGIVCSFTIVWQCI